MEFCKLLHICVLVEAALLDKLINKLTFKYIQLT